MCQALGDASCVYIDYGTAQIGFAILKMAFLKHHNLEKKIALGGGGC